MDYIMRAELKKFLMKKKHIVTDGPFCKTELFLQKNGLDTKKFFKEVIEYQNQYKTVVSNDNALIYTML